MITVGGRWEDGKLPCDDNDNKQRRRALEDRDVDIPQPRDVRILPETVNHCVGGNRRPQLLHGQRPEQTEGRAIHGRLVLRPVQEEVLRQVTRVAACG